MRYLRVVFAAAIFIVTAGPALAQQAPPRPLARAATAPAMVTQSVEATPVINGATSWVVVEVRTPKPATADTEREQALTERARALDERAQALDQRQQTLDAREQALQAREADLAVQSDRLANTVTVKDAFTRDAELSSRIEEGPDQFQPGVDSGRFSPGLDNRSFSPGPADTVQPFFTTIAPKSPP